MIKMIKVKNGKNKMKTVKGMMAIIILLTLSISLIISQSQYNDPPEDLKDVKDKETVEKFINLSPEQKQELWDDVDDTIEGKATKIQALINMKNKIGEDNWKGDVIARGSAVIGIVR